MTSLSSFNEVGVIVEDRIAVIACMGVVSTSITGGVPIVVGVKAGTILAGLGRRAGIVEGSNNCGGLGIFSHVFWGVHLIR